MQFHVFLGLFSELRPLLKNGPAGVSKVSRSPPVKCEYPQNRHFNINYESRLFQHSTYRLEGCVLLDIHARPRV